MVKLDDNLYLINEGDNLTWRILFQENEHTIVYQYFKDNYWSDYQILSNKVNANFSVITLNDKSINIFYTDLNNNVVLSKYINGNWTSNLLIENNLSTANSISFIPFNFEDTIFLFFKNYSLEKESTYIFYQTLKENLTLSSPTFIDKITFPFSNSLVVQRRNKYLYIFYPKLTTKYLLGFKKLEPNLSELSNFTVAIFSDYKLSSYSITSNNSLIEICYEKKLLLEEKNSNLIVSNASIPDDAPTLTLEKFNISPELFITKKECKNLLTTHTKTISNLQEIINNFNTLNLNVNSKLPNITYDKNENITTQTSDKDNMANIEIKSPSEPLSLESKFLKLKNENIKLKAENIKLTRDLHGAEKEVTDLKNKFKIFYKQITKLLER